MKIHNIIKKNAARILLCSVLIINTMSITAYASDEQMLTTGFEENENFRLFKWRTLKALNTLRDYGLTPQAIADNLFGDSLSVTTGNADSAISDYTSDIGQNIADAVQERTEEAVQDATDKATEAAKRQMNNWVDQLGESIGNALRDLIDSIFGGSSEE